MTDHFAAFQLERRPLLDLPRLEEAYARKSAEYHETHRSEAERSALNQAFQVLKDPASRIEYLLKLEETEVRTARVGQSVDRWFGPVAENLQSFDAVYQKIVAQPSALLRAMELGKLTGAVQDLSDLRLDLLAAENEITTRLAEIDQTWTDQGQNRSDELAQIGVDLTFLQRWIQQVNERLLRYQEIG